MKRQPRHARIVSLYIGLTCSLMVGPGMRGYAASDHEDYVGALNGGQWIPFTNPAPSYPNNPGNTMLLLTDGTVIIEAGNFFNWIRLTPDDTGSYVNGTWSVLAPMSTPRLYFASHVLPNGKLWVLGGEYSGSALTQNVTNTGEMYDPVSNTWSAIAPHPEAHFGDDPSMLMPNGKILAGSIFTGNSYLYDIASNTWSFAATKVYPDRSDEEGWVKLPGNKVLTYDLFQSVSTLGSYAELYNPTTSTWSSISPSDGTASGTIPQLSSAGIGFELGPLVRLRDGRIFAIGATGHTAFYNPSTNTWGAGPDIMGTLGGNPALFGADDAPAAVLPNGHVLFAADAGPDAVTSSGKTMVGSAIITGIPSTAGFQVGWAVAGTGIAQNSRITSIDSSNQVHISFAATATSSAVPLRFGGTFSNPAQIFDFDPVTNTISPVPGAPPSLSGRPSFETRMLILPTGQALFSDGSTLSVYTPYGEPSPRARPVIHGVKYVGTGVFTLTGKRLNGQSAGSSYGDDVESDENYPLARLTQCGGDDDRAEFDDEAEDCRPTAPARVFYARTTNWSTVDVATGSVRETVNFTLHSGMTPGKYFLEVIGAGISSFPKLVHITAAEIAGW